MNQHRYQPTGEEVLSSLRISFRSEVIWFLAALVLGLIAINSGATP